MDSLDTQVLDAARSWAAAGHRFALITVARTWGSAPRPPGAWMILRDDGQVQGSVSGGCIEDDLIGRVQRGELAVSLPTLTSYGASAEEAQRFGLPCGGTVQILLERLGPTRAMDELLQRLAAQRRVRRRLALASGAVELADAQAGDGLRLDDEALQTVLGPPWRLLIIGGGQLSRGLAQMALLTGYQVTVCEPRIEYLEGWEGLELTLTRAMPDDAVIALQPDANSAVVALTHDPKLDDLALLEALRSPAFYVGALGSKANNGKRRERLLQYFDLSQAEVDRLHGPVGLPIGSRTPPEIAVVHPGRDDCRAGRRWPGRFMTGARVTRSASLPSIGARCWP
jgi:xanthine dehydrogenase accessory factor